MRLELQARARRGSSIDFDAKIDPARGARRGERGSLTIADRCSATLIMRSSVLDSVITTPSPGGDARGGRRHGVTAFPSSRNSASMWWISSSPSAKQSVQCGMEVGLRIYPVMPRWGRRLQVDDVLRANGGVPPLVVVGSRMVLSVLDLDPVSARNMRQHVVHMGMTKRKRIRYASSAVESWTRTRRGRRPLRAAAEVLGRGRGATSGRRPPGLLTGRERSLD